METLLQIGLTNALLATGLALGVTLLGCFLRRPAVIHCLWIIVLLKLITPPLVCISVPTLPTWWSTAASRTIGSESQDAEAGTNTGGLQPSAADTETEHQSPTYSILEPTPEEAISRPLDLLSETANLGLISDRDAALDFAPATQQFSLSVPWKELVAGVWLTGSLAWLALLAFRIHHFRGQLVFARSLSKPLKDQLDSIARRIGVAQVPEIRIVPGQIPPLLWTLGSRPRLFLPSSLWHELSEDQQVALLAHELAHLKRRDHWVRYLELLVTALYWWHPVVWWACRQMREAEEECCDAWVVWALPATARAYAKALVATVDFLSETGAALPMAASGIGQVRDLRRRLVMIMNGKTPRMLSGAGVLVVLALGALLLPWMPTWAQENPAGSPQPTSDISATDSQSDLKALNQLHQDEQNLLEQRFRAALLAQRSEEGQDERQERKKQRKWSAPSEKYARPRSI